MKKNSRKFLVPLSVAIAGLSAIPAQASVSVTPNVQTRTDVALQQLDSAINQPAHRMIFSKGEELHSLLLARNDQGATVMQHESHYSHSSHSSHSSHRSHYSGY